MLFMDGCSLLWWHSIAIKAGNDMYTYSIHGKPVCNNESGLYKDYNARCICSDKNGSAASVALQLLASRSTPAQSHPHTDPHNKQHCATCSAVITPHTAAHCSPHCCRTAAAAAAGAVAAAAAGRWVCRHVGKIRQGRWAGVAPAHLPGLGGGLWSGRGLDLFGPPE